MYKSRNVKQWSVDCQGFNIFLLPAFWRNFLSVADSIPLREIASQVGSLGGSRVRQEGMLRSGTAVLQPRWTRLLLMQGAEQGSILHHHLQQSWTGNPGPPQGRDAFGTARRHHATGWLSPASWSCSGRWGAGVTVRLCCHARGEDARQKLMGMNWYACASSDFHATVNKDSEYYLEV